MATESVELLKQRASQLTPDEKEDLAIYLFEQAKKDRQAEQRENQSPPSDPYFRREYEWLKQHRDDYAGQYVALDGHRLIAHGTDGRAVLQQARAAGVDVPFIVRIEAPDEPPFGGW